MIVDNSLDEVKKSETKSETKTNENDDEIISIDIPNDANCIATRAFDGSNITSIAVPDNIIYIDNGAFYNCKELTEVIIPSSVRSIGIGAFRDCDKLTSITFLGTVAQWNRIKKEHWNRFSKISQIVCTDENLNIN